MADTKVSYTRGPWRFTDHGDKRHKEFAIMAEDGKVASVFAGFGAHFSWEVSEANARLIVSVHDLLEALAAIAAVGDSPSRIELNVSGQLECRRIARAAIAKATGRP